MFIYGGLSSIFMVFPNKKGHHEVGHTPYVLIGSMIGFLVVGARVLFAKFRKKK